MELITAANEYAVTAAIAVPWDGHHLVLNSHRAGDSDVAVPFGGRVPLDAASWGKVYYAWSGDQLPSKLTAYTDHSITAIASFTQAVREARETGYAVDNQEFAIGVGGVCSAVTSATGYEGLASFLAPVPRIEELTVERLGRRLADLAARASRALGDDGRMRFFGIE
jgi:DNA-binding IclR family transcriptional regulator